MKRWVAGLCVLAVQAVGAADFAPGESQFEVGTRILHVELDNASQPGTLRPGADPSRQTSYDGRFLGTISELDVDQQYLPIRLYGQYFLTPYIGVGVSYDEVTAAARDDVSSDGDLTIQGPIVYLVGRLPQANGFTPFAEIGVAFYQSSFDANPDWTAAGTANEKRMKTDDTTGLVLGLGCDYAINPQWSVNVYARAVLEATVDAQAVYPRQGGREIDFNGSGEFPFDYFGVGIGIKYAFK